MIDEIKKFGLNDYESRAYNALLSSNGSSAVEISRSSGIPRARVYDILLSLESKGFVTKSSSKPIKYFSVQPSKVFETLAKFEKDNLDKALAELSSVALKLDKGVSRGVFDNEGVIEVRGKKAIYSLISQELQNCNDSVLIVSDKEGVKRKQDFFSDSLRKLAASGIRVSAKPGNGRFLKFDNSRVLLFLNDFNEGDDDKAVLINSPLVAKNFS